MRNILSLFVVFLNENSPKPGDAGVVGCSLWLTLLVEMFVFTTSGVLSVGSTMADLFKFLSETEKKYCYMNDIT